MGLVVSGLLGVSALAACTTDSGVSLTESRSPTTSGSPTTSTTETGNSTNDGEEIPQDPDIRMGVLDNGLTYYLRHNESPGQSAELRLAVNAGSGNEEPDQSGVAHFLEHMLFNGTEKFPKNDLIEVLRQGGSQFGADVNAYTSYDETVYQLNVPIGDQLDTGLEVLAQWLSAATLDPVEVASEQGVVLDEWRGSEQSSDGRISDAIEAMFLTGSSYEGRDPIGTDTAITSMTADLLRRFYDDWYRPDNAAVIVVGDIDVDAVEAGIHERFGAIQPRGDSPSAEPHISVSADAHAAVVADPDLTSTAIEVTVPAVAEPASQMYLDQIVDSLGFAMIAHRLSDDAKRGDQPFDDAYVSDNNLVRMLDAPSVVLDSKTGRGAESAQTLLDEFERVHRFGFDDGELQRAVREMLAGVQLSYDSRDSRQDADYADTYVDGFLTGAPLPSAQTEYDLATDLLNTLTPADVAERLKARWEGTAAHVLLYAPSADAASLPSKSDLIAMVAALPTRELEARAAVEVLTGDLMTAPAPATETSSTIVQGESGVYLNDPVKLTFGNGITVFVNKSPIVDGQLTLLGRSLGGLAAVPDQDVTDALAAVDVVTNSGVAGFDQAQLDQLLAGTTAEFYPTISESTDELAAYSSTDDLEQALQLIFLYMTSPRFDPVALDQQLSDIRARAHDPNANPDFAGYSALYEARYNHDLRHRLMLTETDADSIELAGIERVWTQRFGNANGWTFAVSGDIDVEATKDLVRRYLGNLLSTAEPDPATDLDTPPPAGVISETVNAGTGEKGSLLRQYSIDVDDSSRNRVLADVGGEVVSTRLLQVIREKLGESYSPFATFVVTSSPDGGPAHLVLFMQITSGPSDVVPLTTTLSEEIARLVGDGPTDEDVSAAVSVIDQQYQLINNDELGDVLISTEMGFGQSFDDYLDRYAQIAHVTTNDIAEFLRANITLDQYVEIKVLPR